MEIVSTNYGSGDVTQKSRELWIVDNDIAVRSDEPGFPDSWPKNPNKTASMLYRDGDSLRIFVCHNETGNFLIAPGPIHSLRGAEIHEVHRGQPPRPAGATITILAMTWGPQVLEKEESYAYVYACHLTGTKVTFDNGKFGRGDPWSGRGKTGVIFYTIDGDDEVKQLAGQEHTSAEF